MVAPTRTRPSDRPAQPPGSGSGSRHEVRAEPLPGPGPLRRLVAHDRFGQLAVAVVALVLDCWALSTNALGNQYYAAAARSMTGSWHHFFFASLDPGGYISVDKPPVSVWAAALSARAFGYGSLSLLLPSAIAGAAAVALLWTTVRRTSGRLAATVAGLVLALSPINVAVNRLNLPEPFLILVLVAAAWAIVRSFDADHPVRWVVLAGGFVGIGFNTKMLAADVVVPALALAIAMGSRGAWWPRVRNLAAFGLATVVASVPWMLALAVVPKGHRPWMGGSTNDTVGDLVFGYNGVARLAGRGHGAPVHASPATGIGGIIAGVPGPLRFFGPALAGQVTWLFPVVAVGTLAAAWGARRSARQLAPLALWAGWLALYGVVFSTAQGIFHAYYSSVMVPAIAALAGMGVATGIELAAAARARSERPTKVVAVAAGALAATVAWQLVVTGRTPGFYDWTRPLLVALVGGGVAAALVGTWRWRPQVVAGAVAVALAGVLVAPTAWAVSGLGHRSHNATLPQAGPRIGTSGLSFGSTGSDGAADLAAYLRGRNQGETWDLATDNAQQASGLIAYDGLSVMALGGFNGHDPAIDVARAADLVAQRRIRYFAVEPDPLHQLTAFFRRAVSGPAGRTGPAPASLAASLPLVDPAHGPRPLVPSSPAARVLDTVAQVCRPVRLPASVEAPVPRIGNLYDCRGRAPALRRAGRQWDPPRSRR